MTRLRCRTVPGVDRSETIADEAMRPLPEPRSAENPTGRPSALLRRVRTNSTRPLPLDDNGGLAHSLDQRPSAQARDHVLQPLARVGQSSATGQASQRGCRGVQTVLPSSINAWFKRRCRAAAAIRPRNATAAAGLGRRTGRRGKPEAGPAAVACWLRQSARGHRKQWKGSRAGRVRPMPGRPRTSSACAGSGRQIAHDPPRGGVHLPVCGGNSRALPTAAGRRPRLPRPGLAIVGDAARKRGKYDSTVATCVCCSMISLTHTA